MKFDFSTGEEAPSEPYVTDKVVEQALGQPRWKTRRAAKAGLIPSYRFLNGRRLYKISEVVAVINATREGGK
jgi:hypothetical protein